MLPRAVTVLFSRTLTDQQNSTEHTVYVGSLCPRNAVDTVNSAELQDECRRGQWQNENTMRGEDANQECLSSIGSLVCLGRLVFPCAQVPP